LKRDSEEILESRATKEKLVQLEASEDGEIGGSLEDKETKVKKVSEVFLEAEAHLASEVSTEWMVSRESVVLKDTKEVTVYQEQRENLVDLDHLV